MRAGRCAPSASTPPDSPTRSRRATAPWRRRSPTARRNTRRGASSRDNCIDDAQVAGFVCRVGVRKDKKPALNACRNGFRSCVQGCPSTCDPMCPAPCSQVDDSKQCRQQAAADYKTCGATCREEFQFAKDTCRNRDHDCVEGCRAAATLAMQPVQATLDRRSRSARRTSRHAIDLCNGDPMCIEQAQVVAFQCRDDAREAARPGFAACRTGLRSVRAGLPATWGLAQRCLLELGPHRHRHCTTKGLPGITLGAPSRLRGSRRAIVLLRCGRCRRRTRC